MPPRRQPISLELRREYRDLRTHGRLSSLIDFHLNGKNRYMKINQPVFSQNASRTVSPRSSPVRAKTNRFKNPQLNRYDDSGDEEYEAKRYVFDIEEDDAEASKEKKKRTRRRVKHEEQDERKIDEKKVGQTVKMIEDLLKEEKKPRKAHEKEVEPDREENKSRKTQEKETEMNRQERKPRKTQEKESELDEEEKHAYLREKNIQVNLSTKDADDVDKIAKKPKKKKTTDIDSKKNLQTISTQTPRDIYEQLKNDHLRFSENGSVYVKKLVDDVEIIDQEENKDDEEPGRYSKEKGANSLGLSMEGNNGVNMAIIKGNNKGSDQSTKLDSGDQILLSKKYQNLEELISGLMQKGSEENYLKLAKLYRLKVLIELAMKMVGRKYKDISNDERNALEMHANRFHTTYAMPGEEQALEELDEHGKLKTRLPIKIIQHDTLAKIDLNDKFLIDPADILKIYSNKIIDHAHESTGLDFDNITVTIPAAYGAHQRESIKTSLNDASDRDDVKILTRPVAATVIQNNQNGVQTGTDNFKLVFDMTDNSMDASVIKIHEGKDFQVVSNVGDTSFGVHDIDQRIVEYIVKERTAHHLSIGKEDLNATSVETVNAYNHLIKSIKESVVESDAVSVDLASLGDKTVDKPKSSNEVTITKKLIGKKLCKDIYDWSLVHIEKAIIQADIDYKHIDEIILIGSEAKFPGFKELLKETYPKKKITFVSESDLAIGAAIVGKKLKYQQIKVTEVLCRSIGIGLYTGVITYLLFRNSSLPCVGGCVYSTLVDDQETMVLDVYEGERPHVKFCRYLGEVTIYNLPKGESGKIKCEVYLKMNNEGILEVNAKELTSGKSLETAINANPENFDPDDVNNNTELDPIEAERYKKPDYDFVYQLETLDEYLESISLKFRKHKAKSIILDKVFDTKEWLYKNRKNVSIKDIQQIRKAIDTFLKNVD